MCSSCALFVQLLCSFCAAPVLILCSSYAHFVQLLCSICAAPVLILCSSCAHFVQLLCSLCAAAVLILLHIPHDVAQSMWCVIPRSIPLPVPPTCTRSLTAFHAVTTQREFPTYALKGARGGLTNTSQVALSQAASSEWKTWRLHLDTTSTHATFAPPYLPVACCTVAGL